MGLYVMVVTFQSTPPARGATRTAEIYKDPETGISIHAPREGGDMDYYAKLSVHNISIHAPREGGDSRLLW